MAYKIRSKDSRWLVRKREKLQQKNLHTKEKDNAWIFK